MDRIHLLPTHAESESLRWIANFFAKLAFNVVLVWRREHLRLLLGRVIVAEPLLNREELAIVLLRRFEITQSLVLAQAREYLAALLSNNLGEALLLGKRVQLL